MPVIQQPSTFRTSFDQAAADYDAVRPGYPPALIHEILNFARLSANGRILEIGCGTGQATIPFAQRGYQMTCLDIGPELAALVAKNCKPYPNVQIQVTSFEDWRPEPDKFDLVIAATAFHWIAPEIAYPKVARLLRETGALAIFSNEHPPPAKDSLSMCKPFIAKPCRTRSTTRPQFQPSRPASNERSPPLTPPACLRLSPSRLTPGQQPIQQPIIFVFSTHTPLISTLAQRNARNCFKALPS
jgi:SAM-dependent methyltransferase